MEQHRTKDVEINKGINVQYIRNECSQHMEENNLFSIILYILYLYMYIFESNNPQQRQHQFPFADLQTDRDLKAFI